MKALFLLNQLRNSFYPRLIGFTAALFLFSGCNYLQNVRLLLGGKLGRENFVQMIPFEMREDIIVVKARLNSDTTQREFIFDTGAFNSKVEKGLAESLGMETFATKNNSTAQGVSQEIEVGRIDSIVFGETAFYQIGAGKVEYAENSASPCIAPHGLIGANLIKLANWKIDYQKKQMYFSDSPFEPDPGKEIIKLPFDRPVLSATPKVTIKVGGKELGNVLFDIGFNGGLVLPLELKDHFPSETEMVVYDRSTSGIYGTNTDTLISKKLNLELGNFSAEIPVEFSALGKGLLGNEFLKHFTVLIDNDQNEIILQPEKAVNLSPSSEFMPGVLNDSLWVVNRTTEGSKFQLGDTLRSINGFQPRDLFSGFCDYRLRVGQLLNGDSLAVESMNGEMVKFH